MKKKLLSVFMVLCLMLAMLPAAFADETAEPTDLSSQIASAGDTIYLESGTYVISSRVSKPVSLVAKDGADVTIYGDVVYGNGSWTDVTTGEAAKTITISGIDFVKGNETCNLAICLSSGVSGYTLNVESCTFSDYEYGVTANSGATQNTILVNGNSEFHNVGCALSLQEGNTLSQGQVFTCDGFVMQHFGTATDVYYDSITDYESDVESGTYNSGIDNTEDGITVVTSATKLLNAFTNGKDDVTLYLANDITLTQPVNLTTGDKVTLIGRGNTINFSGNDSTGTKVVFTAPAGAQVEGIPSNTTVNVSDVTFNSTDDGANGYAVLVGGNSFNTSVTLDNCGFVGLYSAVYVNQTTSEPEDNGSYPTIAITDSVYDGTSYAYAIDEYSNGALSGTTTVDITGSTGFDNLTEEWNTVSITRNGQTTTYNNTYSGGWDAVFGLIQAGDTVTLNTDVTVTNSIKLPDNVTINGNNHSITMTGSSPNSDNDHNSLIYGGSNCVISNVTLDAGGFKHGVQFYKESNSELNNVNIKGGTFTSVMVNGSQNIAIRNCTLNTNGYAHIEYGMGGGVTTIPSIIVEDNTFGTAGKAQIYADADTTGKVKNAMGNDPTNAQIRERIMHSITNEGVTNVVVSMILPEDSTVTNVTSQGNNIVVPTPHAITITQPANGSVSTSLSNASKGAVITVTATPNAGYELAYITVNGEKITGNTFVMPDEAVTVSAVFVTSSFPFVDVSTGAWYYDAVNYVYTNGLMDGVSDTTFNPDGSMTRAMVWAILARLDGQTVTGANWATVARNWAVREGVSDGENANGLVTREQLATMIWRYVGEPKSTYSLGAFTDASSVSDWAATAMAWAVENGIITGVTATTLVPQGTASRAQCAAILMRCVEL